MARKAGGWCPDLERLAFLSRSRIGRNRSLSGSRVYKGIARGLLVCFMLVLAVAAAALWAQSRNDQRALNRADRALVQANSNYRLILDTQARQSNGIVHSCIRLNILRAVDNASHYSDYLYISQQVRYQSSSLRSNFLALKHIGIPQAVLDRALKQQKESLTAERRQVTAKTWVPLTDCAAVALSSGGTYSPPEAISFMKSTPPMSALDSANAAKVDPAGSVP